MGQEARLKNGRRRARQACPAEPMIDLLGTVTHLNKHLTESLCEGVFSETRVRERERLWDLYALAKFWANIVLRSPGSLTQALEEAGRGGGMWPPIQGSSQAFFRRSKVLKWKFFAAIYHRFVCSLTATTPPCFAGEFAFLRKDFPEVWIVDGSRLDAVAHRLKIAWDVRSPLLPGCLLAFYDLFRGYPRLLGFAPDAAQAEMNRVRQALEEVPPDTLLLGDRLYASVQLFHEMAPRRIWGLFRLNGTLIVRKIRRMSRRRVNGGVLEDWLAEVGSGVTAPSQRLRYIRFRRGRILYQLLTNVLDPNKLSATTAMELYPRRWNIERMFFDLKEVLNLNRFYAANPNGVAMQVYAAAMVYVALRVAQSQAALQSRVQPEEISPAKFFPRVANACLFATGVEVGYQLACRENPHRRLRLPDLRGRPELTTTLRAIRVRKRKGRRRKRRFCLSRRQWKSFAHIPHTKMFMN